MELTRSFTADQFARTLESWDWADIQGKQPLFTSPFGDVFFQARDGIWFLDLLEGTLTRPWPDAGAMQAELNTAEGQDRYLMAGPAFAAERRGIIPSARQVPSFKVAPVLGAAIAVENIEVMDFEVIVHITGQLVRAVTAVPAAPSPAGGGGTGSMCRWYCSNLPNGTSTQSCTASAGEIRSCGLIQDALQACGVAARRCARSRALCGAGIGPAVGARARVCGFVRVTVRLRA